jgi:hypothetical protein
MKRFIARAQPEFKKVLVIESGERETCERALRYLYDQKNPGRLDVLTCFAKPPAAFNFEAGNLYSVHDRRARENRAAFIGDLCASGYDVIAILCTGSAILQKWKWVLAARSASRILIFNEHAKYFSLDLWNLRYACKLLARRLNPFEGNDQSLPEVLLNIAAAFLVAPFTIGFLALYAARVHLRRHSRLSRTTS